MPVWRVTRWPHLIVHAIVHFLAQTLKFSQFLVDKGVEIVQEGSTSRVQFVYLDTSLQRLDLRMREWSCHCASDL